MVRRKHLLTGGGGVVGLGAMSYGLLWSEAKLARRVVKPPEEGAPLADGTYGSGAGHPLRLTMVGDSSAAGMGAHEPAGTPGALLATELAAAAGRPVLLDVVAVVGARSSDLAPQVDRLLLRRPDVAVVMIGANDVTHLVSHSAACTDLGVALVRLRKAGVHVVVGTCPDLGTVKPVLQPLRWVGGLASRRMAARQARTAMESGGVAVPLGNALGVLFDADETLWSADRFHPSAAGYERIAAVLLPATRAAVGLQSLPAAARETAAALADVGARLDPARARASAEAAAEESGEGVATARGGTFGVLRRLVRRGGPGPVAAYPEGPHETSGAADADSEW